MPRPRKGPVTPRSTGQSPKAPRPSPGAWHAACGIFARGRAACWSEHHRIGELARSSSQRPQIALIWTTAQSMPRGLALAPNDGSGVASTGALLRTGRTERAHRRSAQ
jgi:hypothetical protein